MGRVRLVLLTLAVALFLLPGGAQAQDEEFSVTFVAVRQGDAAVYRGPCGELALIDTNAHRHAEVLAVLDGYGSRQLSWINASHYHADHIGGLQAVATASGASVGVVYDRGGDRDAYDSQTYRDYYDWVTGPTVTRQPVNISDVLTLCSGDQQVRFEVLSVGRDGTAAGGVTVSNEDDHSVCLKVTYREFNLATCGDLSGTDEGDRRDVESVVAPGFDQVDVARINHHGSANSSNQTYVDTLRPPVAVVSTGANGHGHPVPAVLDRWRVAGAFVYQTHKGGPGADGGNDPVHGDITVTTVGDGSFSVTTSTGRDQASYGSTTTPPPPSPPAEREDTAGCPADRVPDAEFTDTSGNAHWHFIDCVAWWEITGGLGDGRYGPALAVRRDQMASFTARTILNSGGTLPEASEHPGFTDTAGNPHEANIRRLAAAGVVAGTGPDSYNPASAVRRDQMATFLVRSYEHRTGETLTASRDHFTDTSGSVHRDNINKAAEAGFTSGTGPGTYAPAREVRRDQMASFLARVLNRLVERGHTTPPG